MKAFLASVVAYLLSPLWFVKFVAQYSRLNFFQSLRVKKGPGCVIDSLVWIQSGRNIRLGKFVKVSMFSSLLAGERGEIDIGDFTIIGPNCTIVAMNHGRAVGSLPFRYQPWVDDASTSIRIGSNVWIGASVTILPGTHIGDNSVIAAGTVIKGSITPNSLVIEKGRVSNLTIYPL